MMNDGDVHWDDWLAKREQVRARVARFINAEPDEIGFDYKHFVRYESDYRFARKAR